MILVSRGNQSPHYSARPLPNEGWCIYEGREPIAYCDTEAYALAIAQALNFQRLMVTAKTVVLTEPRGNVGLN